MDLEVLSKRQEDVKRELIVIGIRIVLLDMEEAKQQRKGDREAERGNGGLVKHNRPVPVKVKLRLIHSIFSGGN